jgi:hypothetical protein
MMPKGRSSSARRDSRKQHTDGAGYTDLHRTEFIEQHGSQSLATGDLRTCVVDAGWNATPEDDRSSISHSELVSIVPGDGRSLDTSFDSLNVFYGKHGLYFDRVTEKYSIKGGPALNLLKNETGRFVVQLRITIDQKDNNPAWHCVAYTGALVIDNDAGTTIKIVEPRDRQNKKAAHAVFTSFFKPGVVVRLTNIYELVAR